MDTYINKIDLPNITSLINRGALGKCLRTGIVFDLSIGKATYNERK